MPRSSVTSLSIAAAPAPALRRFHHGNLRQALIDAALAAPDIENLSLRQLAASVGVTAPAAYRHFGSREELLDEVARIGFERLEARFAAAFDIAQPPADAADARSRLQRLAQAYLAFADDEPALWRLMFGALAAAYRAGARPVDRRNSYDYLPAALLTQHDVPTIRSTVSLLLLGIERRWWWALAVGAILMVAFVIHALRRRDGRPFLLRTHR